MLLLLLMIRLCLLALSSFLKSFCSIIAAFSSAFAEHYSIRQTEREKESEHCEIIINQHHHNFVATLKASADK